MDNKNNSAQFDLNKICRACLSERTEMRSIFHPDETIGQTTILAEMIMGFSSVQVNIYNKIFSISFKFELFFIICYK